MATRAEGAVGGSRRTVAAAALALAAVVLFPFLWLLLMSFKSEEDIFASPMTPFVPTLDNYVALWQGGFPRSFANSAIVSLSSTAVAMAVGVPAGYALSRLPRATSDWWSLLILASRMAPPIAFTIPFFLAYRHVGLLDTLAGLILVYLTFNLSLVIWMMRSYFEECPRSLEEAAWLDGASMLQTFTRSRPAAFHSGARGDRHPLLHLLLERFLLRADPDQEGGPDRARGCRQLHEP